MGFGKWLLGGACAVGAVIAAPVVLPVAGVAMIGSSTVGAVSATALAAGVVGKKISDARSEGRQEGYEATSEVYNEKFRSLGDATEEAIENWQQVREEYEQM